MTLAELAHPAHTALLTQECQTAAVGRGALWPALAEAARPVLGAVGRLVRAARGAGVPVVHCVAARRADLRGSNRNAPVFAAARRAGGLRLGTEAVEVVPEVGLEAGDLVVVRLHGVSPFSGTGLDPLLRNLGVRTVVGAGVSVNVAIWALVMDAIERRVPGGGSQGRRGRRAPRLRPGGGGAQPLVGGHGGGGRGAGGAVGRLAPRVLAP